MRLLRFTRSVFEPRAAYRLARRIAAWNGRPGYGQRGGFMRLHRVLPLATLVALGFAPAAAARGHGGDHDYGEGRVQVKTIARGLDSPRHLAFGARGALYVAEAGRGSGGSAPCLASAEGPGCFGATGAV